MVFQYQGGNMMRGAALQNQQQQSFFDQLARGIQAGQQNQARELKKQQILLEQQEKANDPARLGTEQIINDLMAKGMTRGQAAAQLVNAKSQKVYQDETGTLVRQPSIFDSLNLDRATPYVPEGMRVGGASTNIPGVFSQMSPQDTTGVAGTPKGRVMEYQNNLDIEKERAKAQILQEKNSNKERQEQQKQDVDTMPILQDMLKYNAGTLEMPFAGTAQPIARLTNKDAAKNMALLKQRQLGLAAPLAKQLGVNPTDKDFENTLNQIFNENESRETREAMIKNLISDIQRRQQGFTDPKEQQQFRNEQIKNSPNTLNTQKQTSKPTKEQALEILKQRGLI